MTITARDSSGASNSVAVSFPVTNAGPAAAVTGPASARIGVPVDFTLTATDASLADEAAGFAWSVNFGDGTAPLALGAGTLSPAVRARSFANSGVYTVTATATDKDGGVSLAASHQITITGPPSIVPFNFPAFSATTLTASANVLSDGGDAVTQRGVLYAPAATNPNPLLGGTGVLFLANASAGTGPFTLALTHLTPETAYRYRFYATNTQGTSYTPVRSFTTTANHAPLLGLNGATGIFTATGSMVTPRSDHAANLLPDGKVLVTGGFAGGTARREAELYDPASGGWTAAPSMAVERLWHTATTLADGNVLISGGSQYPTGTRHISTEIFESATNTWMTVGNLTSSRILHTATLLRDGQVLVAGGGTNVAELYQPATGLWTPISGASPSRSGHTATLLNDGRVLLTGGILGDGTQVTTSEIFDPATRSWSTAAATATPHHYHTANLLPDGRVILTGGFINNTGLIGGVEIYDPVTNSWTAGTSPAVRRIRHTSSLLTDGRMLISGGLTTGDLAVGGAELYDPVTGAWANAGTSASVRSRHTASSWVWPKVTIGTSTMPAISVAARCSGPADSVGCDRNSA